MRKRTVIWATLYREIKFLKNLSLDKIEILWLIKVEIARLLDDEIVGFYNIFGSFLIFCNKSIYKMF